jgi:hypothetical protein
MRKRTVQGEKEYDGQRWGTIEEPDDPRKPAATRDTEVLAQNSASSSFISRQNVHRYLHPGRYR